MGGDLLGARRGLRLRLCGGAAPLLLRGAGRGLPRRISVAPGQYRLESEVEKSVGKRKQLSNLSFFCQIWQNSPNT